MLLSSAGWFFVPWGKCDTEQGSGSSYIEVTSNLPSWTFYSWVTFFTMRAFTLVFFIGVSYFTTELACTRLLHIITIRLHLLGRKPRF